MEEWERAINEQTEMPSEWALQIAARCWCDDDTGHCVMDKELAVAFARRLDALAAFKKESKEAKDE